MSAPLGEEGERFFFSNSKAPIHTLMHGSGKEKNETNSQTSFSLNTFFPRNINSNFQDLSQPLPFSFMFQQTKKIFFASLSSSLSSLISSLNTIKQNLNKKNSTIKTRLK